MTALTITDADIGDKLYGKSAIITGGSSGIGLGIVQKLTEHGVKVLVGDIQDHTELGVLFQHTDASSWDDLLALFTRGMQEFGRIDIVIPNAGIDDQGDYFDDENRGTYTVKLAMHFMRKQRPQGGVIVSTVSRSGYDCPSSPVYAASKHGMIGLMRGLRLHTKTWNIRVNSIAPHLTDTAAILPTIIQDLRRAGIPVCTIEETARAAVFICANESYHGCTISIMGSEYRELESGVERYKRDIMGNDPRFDMTSEQQDIMDKIFLPASKW